MSRLLSGLLACTLLLSFSGNAAAQRQAERGTQPDSARCGECGSRVAPFRRAGSEARQQAPAQRLEQRRRLMALRMGPAAQEGPGEGRGRRGDARGGEGRRRGEARGGQGKRGERKGEGKRGDGKRGDGKRGEREGNRRRGDSEEARKRREKLRKEADTNGDGKLDKAEREAMRKKIQERRKRGGEGRGGERRPV